MGWVDTSKEMLKSYTGDGELDFEAEIENAVFDFFWRNAKA